VKNGLNMIHIASGDKRMYNQVKEKMNHPIGLQSDGIRKSENTGEGSRGATQKIGQNGNSKVSPSPLVCPTAQEVNPKMG
jgi:hypothetical protein